MIKFFTKRMNNRKGFTLIELVVVIAILGILAALAIPRLSGSREKAVKATVEADARTIFSDLEVKYAEDGKYPESYTLSGSFTGTVSEYKTTDNGEKYSMTYTHKDGKYSVEITEAGVGTATP